MTIIEANLAALARCNPGLAEKLEAVEPAPSVSHLCSRVDPVREAEAVAAESDIRYNALLVVLGFGAGWHVAALARKMNANGMVFVLEPDLSILKRALIDHDHSESFTLANVVIFDGTELDGDFSTVYRGGEGMFAIGVQIIDHLPSRARLAGKVEPFLAMLERCCDAVRCNIATCKILCQLDIINRLGNIAAYIGLGKEYISAFCDAMRPYGYKLADAGGPA